MAKLVFTDCRLFVGAADLSGNSNMVEIDAEVEPKITTNFRSGGAEERLGGLFSADINAAGQWEAGDVSKVDDNQWATLFARSGGAWTLCPTDAVVAAVAYLTKAVQGKYAPFGQVGDVLPWKGSAKSTSSMPRGQIAHPPGTARTVTGTGTALQLGAVAPGQSLYANLHVLSVTGTGPPSITARVETDNTIGFPSPTTPPGATFAAATAPGGQSLVIPGPLTDDWFRAAWTITGGGPSFLFALALGIA